MSVAITDYLRRSLLPSLVIATSRMRGPRPALVRTASRLGLPVRLEVYFAFDDPYAVIGLSDLFADVLQRNVSLQLYPLLRRGIVDDPAQAERARHALVDAQRLASRRDQRLQRLQPLAAKDCDFLAAWTQSARSAPETLAFAVDALNLLWRGSAGPVLPWMFEALYRKHLRRAPPAIDRPLLASLQANTDRLHAKGHWESPSVRLAGEWFFAHERQALISRRLDELGA